MIILTIFQSDWREPQICQFLSLKSDYFDNFQSDWRELQICQFLSLKSNYFDNVSVWLDGAPDLSMSFFKNNYFDNVPVWMDGAPYLSISFFTKWLFWQFSSLTGWSPRSVNFCLQKVIILTVFQFDWRDPQIYQFLSLKSHYFDHFPVWLDGAPDLSISFFKKWVFWQFSNLTGGSPRSLNFFL